MFIRLQISCARLFVHQFKRNDRNFSIARQLAGCMQKSVAAATRKDEVFIPKNNQLLIKHRLACSSVNSPVPVADYEEVKDLKNHPEKLLIDVREPKELSETGKIPTSINIPLGIVEGELTADANKFKAKYNRDKPSKDTEIIFHCKSGIRSEKAAQAAVRQGYKNIKNYKGSWLEWADKESLNK